MDDGVSSGTGLHLIDRVLIVPVGADPDDQAARRLRRDVLAKTESASPKGVILDVSAVRVLDSYTFSILAETARMTALLGAKTIFVGFQAGVASALIDLDVNVTDLQTAVTVDDALELLRSQSAAGPRLEGEAEAPEDDGEIAEDLDPEDGRD